MIKVDFIVDSKVTEENFEDIVEEWLSGGDYTPNDIIENIINEQNLKLLPVHHYKARFSGLVGASLGYNRTEFYQVYNSQTKRYETASRTVTDWRPHVQNVDGEVTAVEYAGNNTYIKLADFIDGTGWKSEELNVLTHDTSTDTTLTSLFTLDQNQTWNDRAGQRCLKKASRIARASLPIADKVDNFTTDLKFDVHYAKSLLVPFWIYTYIYKEKTYYVVVDGNNPERVTGERPVNKSRKATVLSLRWIGWPSGIYGSYKIAEAFAYGPNYDREWGDWKTVGLFLIGFAVTWIVVEGIVNIIKSKSKQKRQDKLVEKRKGKITPTNN